MAAVAVEILRCEKCGTLDAGPRQLCPNCHAFALKPQEVPGKGKLVSWTIIRRAPLKLKALQPYAVCVVDLDVGVRVTGRFEKLDTVKGDAAPGQRVECAARDGLVPLFALEA